MPDEDPERTVRFTRLRSWLPRLVFAGLVLSVIGVGLVLWYVSTVPLPSEVPPERTTIIYASDGTTRLASLSGGEDRTPVTLGEVPQVVRDAVLASEDRRFYEHGGIDPFGVARALWADLRSSSARQGGSTITQQYVKNVYVGRDRTARRKVREAILAVKLEQKLSKHEILERYLNTIYFGRGAYGVQAAARTWFGKDVQELGVQEASYLAALIRSPEGTDVAKNPERAKERRSSVLATMAKDGSIDESTRALVEDTPIQTYVLRRADKPPDVAFADIGMEYVIDWVRAQLIAGHTEQVALAGGLRVTTTIDVDLQRAAYEAVNGTLREDSDPSGALVAVDDAGHVVAMVGGRDHGHSQVNLALGKDGGGSGRQAGSTFKPFLLAEIVASGYSVESAFPAPAQIVIPDADEGRDYKVRNYDDRDYEGQLSMVEATRMSVNTVYAQAAQAIGPEKMAEMAHRLGIRSELSPHASLVLGTEEVSVLEMTAAFATFADDGMRTDPRMIQRVENADHEVIDDGRAKEERVLSEDDAAVVTFCLRQVIEGGTGTAARLGRPAAGKTGTTNESTDAWFIGYAANPRITAGVWMGWADDGSRPMDRVRGRAVTGGGLPAEIWHEFMTAATRGEPPGRFREPGDLGGETIPRSSGRQAFDPSDSSQSDSSTPSSIDESSTTTADDESSTTTDKPAATTTTKPQATTTSTVKKATTSSAKPAASSPP